VTGVATRRNGRRAQATDVTPHPIPAIEGATVEPDLDHPAPAEAPGLPALAGGRPTPLVRLRTAFNTAALLSTTAVLVAIDPKSPPFRAD
jgi:hypothetical protein